MSEGFNGFTNWESFSFSAHWSNDQEVYSAVKRAGREWLAANAPKDDSTELGAAIVAFIRGGRYRARFVGPKRLETEAEWDAIDRAEVGEEVKAALEGDSEPAVTTWADGFGNWHARVTEQGAGDPVHAREMARKAIVAELTQREAPGWAPDGLMLEVVAVVASVPLGQTGPALDTTTEFVEKWPTD